jgi:hypothetical protein
LAIQFGNSVWFGNLVWQFGLEIQFGILVWQLVSVIQFGISVWHFGLTMYSENQFGNSFWFSNSAWKFGNSVCCFGILVQPLGLTNQLGNWFRSLVW